MIGLISCSAQKLDRPAPARDLYCSPLFRKSLAFAESRCQGVYVLSAALGLVELDQQLEPYDRRLGDKEDRRAWADGVAGALIDRHGVAETYLLLAGADYARPLLSALRWRGWRGRVREPLQGLQIGERLRALNEWSQP